MYQEQKYRKSDNFHSQGSYRTLSEGLARQNSRTNLLSDDVEMNNKQLRRMRRKQNQSYLSSAGSYLSSSMQWVSDGTKDLFSKSTQVQVEVDREAERLFEEKVWSLAGGLDCHTDSALSIVFNPFMRSTTLSAARTQLHYEEANIVQKIVSAGLSVIGKALTAPSLIVYDVATGMKEDFGDAKMSRKVEDFWMYPADWALTAFNGTLEKKELDTCMIASTAIGLVAASTMVAAGTTAAISTAAATIIAAPLLCMNIVLPVLKHMNVPVYFQILPGGPFTPTGIWLNNVCSRIFGLNTVLPNWVFVLSLPIPVRPILALLITYIICKAIAAVINKYEIDRKFKKMQKDIKSGEYSIEELQMMYPQEYKKPVYMSRPDTNWYENMWAVIRFGREALTGV